jgi:membrane dipeptidase
MRKLSRRDFLRWLAATGALSVLPAHADQSSTLPPIIVDGHIDLGYNIVNFGRDYRRSALDIRADTAGTFTEVIAGQATIGLPELQAARMALLFGVIFLMPTRLTRSSLQVANYSTPAEAHTWGMRQLEAIEAFAEQTPEVEIVKSGNDLTRILASWDNGAVGQLGIVLAMEGADPIQSPADLHLWYEHGLRSIGLSWARTQYAGSSSETSRLTDAGRALLSEMRALNMLLDIAHLAEASFWDALNMWDGVTAYTHGTLRHFLPTQRALSDEQIRALIEHDGVIGIGLYNGFFEQNLAYPPNVTIDDVVHAIDYVCQIAGDCLHVAIGSDLDGGFGAELTPIGINTVADLQQLVMRLSEYGFSTADINGITHENWLRLLRQIL